MNDGGTRFWYPVMYDTGTLGHKSSCLCMDIARVLISTYLKFELFCENCEAIFGSVLSLLSSWLCLPTELGFGSRTAHDLASQLLKLSFNYTQRYFAIIGYDPRFSCRRTSTDDYDTSRYGDGCIDRAARYARPAFGYITYDTCIQMVL